MCTFDRCSNSFCCCCNDNKIKIARKPGKKPKENIVIPVLPGLELRSSSIYIHVYIYTAAPFTWCHFHISAKQTHDAGGDLLRLCNRPSWWGDWIRITVHFFFFNLRIIVNRNIWNNYVIVALDKLNRKLDALVIHEQSRVNWTRVWQLTFG